MARASSPATRTAVHVTWISSSKQELIERVRARLPRELTDEGRRWFHLAALARPYAPQDRLASEELTAERREQAAATT
jgi:hypothetical protein